MSPLRRPGILQFNFGLGIFGLKVRRGLGVRAHGFFWLLGGVAEQLGPDATIVTVMCDTRMKYFKTFAANVRRESERRS